MKNGNLIFAISVESFTNDLVDSAKEGLEWGSTIGVAFTASLLAISIIHYLFFRS